MKIVVKKRIKQIINYLKEDVNKFKYQFIWFSMVVIIFSSILAKEDWRAYGVFIIMLIVITISSYLGLLKLIKSYIKSINLLEEEINSI